MKHFRSEKAFAKYKPEESWKKKLSRVFKRKQRVVAITDLPSHYKSNPYKPQNQIKPDKIRLKLTFFIILTLAWLFCLAYTPYFKINKILYFNLGNTSRAEVESFIYKNYLNRKSWLPLNNYFFISSNKLASDIKNNFSLEHVIVTKVFPNGLNIEVKEKISAIIYDNGKKYFLLDKEGTVIKFLADVGQDELKLKPQRQPYSQLSASTSTTSTNQNLAFSTSNTLPYEVSYEHTPSNENIKSFFIDYPIVYDRRNIEVEDKEKNILAPEYIDSIIAWNKELSERGRLKPKFFVFDNLNSGIVIETGEPWYIIFQPKNDAKLQMTVLEELLATIKPKAYIDLRFGEKVYWK
jgi:hypothetical protein